MSTRSIVQVTLWDSPYLGNFMASELMLAGDVRARFGLSTHFVLGADAAGQPWLSDLEAAGASWSVLSPDPADCRRHLDGSSASAPPRCCTPTSRPPTCSPPPPPPPPGSRACGTSARASTAIRSPSA